MKSITKCIKCNKPLVVNEERIVNKIYEFNKNGQLNEEPTEEEFVVNLEVYGWCNHCGKKYEYDTDKEIIFDEIIE